MKTVQPEGNLYNKYENKSKIINLIMDGFFNNIGHLIDSIEYSSVYEAGCGEGYISKYIYEHNLKKTKQLRMSASDLSEKVIEVAKLNCPQIRFYASSIYNIQEIDESYDLVIACEVLEHLENPEIALKELLRISRRYVIISVPNEPIWCIANLARGKYIKSFGNTPGHINHWSKKAIEKLVGSYGIIGEINNPFPWTIILLEKKL